MRSRSVLVVVVLVGAIVSGWSARQAFCDCNAADPVFIQKDRRNPEAIQKAREEARKAQQTSDSERQGGKKAEGQNAQNPQ